MTNVKCCKKNPERINQGDIYKDIWWLDKINDPSDDGFLDVSIIEFPYVFVLSQDCDLDRDEINRIDSKPEKTYDKYLISVLVAPIYVAEHIFTGTHLEYLEMSSNNSFSSKQKEQIRKNQVPRYHYLEFDSSIELAPSIIDFKHYFSVNTDYIRYNLTEKYLCSVSKLFRERICQRFSNYLSRIGLPEINV